MKKIIAIALALASTAAAATTFLMYEEFVDGRIKVCVYADGRTLVIPAQSRCPTTL